MSAEQDHERRVNRIARKVQQARERGERPVIYHGQSHSARPDDFEDDAKIHIEQLDHVIDVDEEDGTITVEPDITMRELLEATLEHGLVPHVVPEFPTITVGGGIQGGAGESSCFRYGLFGKQATRFEVVTGDGEIIEATPKENSDLFNGVFGSYGSIGILTEVEMDLLPATEYVELTYHRVESYEDAVDTLEDLADEKDIHYLDGIMFSPDRGVIMAGRRTDEKNHEIERFTRAHDEWFYIHADRVSDEHQTHTETIPIRDYFFRYDIGAFWTVRYGFDELHLPFNRLTRTLLHPVTDTETAYMAGVHEGHYTSKFVLQDIITPHEETAGFMRWIEDNIGVFPLWLLPMQPDTASELAPSNLDTDFAINVGIWGLPDTDEETATIKKDLEKKAAEIGARKTLYAQQFYTEDEFWSIYDRDWYNDIRERYDADGVFTDVYDITYTDELPEPSRSAGIRAMLRSKLD